MNKNMLEVAKGIELADLVLKNGYVINVFSEEIIKCDVAIFEDKIVGLGNYQGKVEIDCTDKYISPGFIDAHMHIESTMVTPLEFAKSVIKKGTTSAIIDPHEIVNVLGKEGLDYMLEATKNIPITTHIMIPSSVPATDIDINGAGKFLASDMQEYLLNKQILGLGEVMRFNDVNNGSQEMLDKLKLFNNKTIDGHAPGLSGKKLQAYRLAGISNDHECETSEEALEKLRAGFQILIREGSAARNLEAIITGLLKAEVSLENCLFCTDDKHLEDIEIEGHINYIVRKAIELQTPILKAYKMASYNTARAYNLRDVGAIIPGYKADILIIDDLEKVEPSIVIKNGLIMDDKQLSSYYQTNNFSDKVINSIKCQEIKESDLQLKVFEENHLIELVPNSLLTIKKVTKLPKKDNYFVPNEIYNKLCVIERHGRTNNIGVCALTGYGIKNGAIATSVAHDAHNIIVVGDNDQDISVAVNHLKAIQGGYVIVSNGQVINYLTLEIAGLMSRDTNINVQTKIKEMVVQARDLGVIEGVEPFITLSFISLAVIPEIRLSESGLYDVKQQKFIQ